MAEDPIVIRGGSLSIEARDHEFEDDTGNTHGKKLKIKAKPGKKGKITRVNFEPGDPPTITIYFDDDI
jgi:hypothetical protein